jgi:glycosyltransferase involved in cell wall biosynthesis
MRQVKVLEIQGDVGPGGSERHTLILSKELKRADNFDVVIVGPYSRNLEMVRQIQSLGIVYYGIDLARKATFVKCLKDIVQVVRDEGIQVIHTHLRNADIYGIVAGILARVPVVATLHGRTGPLDGTSSVKSRLVKLLHAQLLRHGTEKIIAISNFVKEFSVKDLGLDPGKVRVIHNCTEPERFNLTFDVVAFRRDLGVQPQEKLVSLIGGISRQKGAHHFVEVADLVAREEKSVKFLVAGQGDFEDEMRDRVRKRALSDRFIFAGWRPDVPRLLHATDILVMAAYQEGFGRVVTEAMAASKPVIAFASGGVSEIVVHSETGYLVSYGNVREMASYAIGLLRDEARCQVLGQAGRKRFKKLFTPRAFVERTKNVLESAVG